MMITQIIEDGHYEFNGNVDAFKKCISSFKVTKVIREGKIMGYKFYDAIGKFRYHGKNHKIFISKSWIEDKLYIDYEGEE